MSHGFEELSLGLKSDVEERLRALLSDYDDRIERLERSARGRSDTETELAHLRQAREDVAEDLREIQRP